MILATCNLWKLIKCFFEVYPFSYNNDSLSDPSGSSFLKYFSFTVELGSPTHKINDNWKMLTGIYILRKTVLFYIGWATYRFLLHGYRKPTHLEANCLKLHQPCFSGYESICI